jgi:hypothetical protein
MIIVCEISFDDGAHVPFNAGLLATVHAAFPKEDVSFFGAPAHVEELKKEVGQGLRSFISWKMIRPPAPGTGYVQRFVRELRIIRELFGTIPEDNTSHLLFASAYPSTVLAVKIAQYLSTKCPPVQMVIHGMSGVVGKRYRHPGRRFQDTRTALALLGNKGIQYLVLEENIRDTLLNNAPFLKGTVEVLEHPMSPNEVALDTLELNEPIRFGFLGLADKAKGFPLFVKVARDIVAKYGRRAEFHVIGRAPQNEASVAGIEVLATKPGMTLMSRESFLLGVRPLHFIVLPHDFAAYTLTTSGVLLDAVAWQKPVIARRIPIFEAMFKRHGDIGYLFSDETHLKEILSTLLKMNDKSRYYQQVANLGDAKKARSPESVAIVYREICRKIAVPRT